MRPSVIAWQVAHWLHGRSPSGAVQLSALARMRALLVLPLLWSAWLNQRAFRFDALAEHATPGEMQLMVREDGRNFYMAGLATAAAAYVPLLNLLAPAFAALVFVHLGLAALRRRRQEGGVVL